MAMYDLLARIDLPASSQPGTVSVSPDGTRAYTVNTGAAKVSVINATTNTYITDVTVGSYPYYLVVRPDSTRAYVPNYFGNSTSVINTTNNTISATPTQAMSAPVGVAVHPDGTKFYVANRNGQQVCAYNTSNNSFNTSVATTACADYPRGMAITPDGSKLYVADELGAAFACITTSDFAVTKGPNISTSAGSSAVAVKADGTRVYFHCQNDYKIAVVNTSNNSLVTTISVPNPSVSITHGQMAAHPDNQRLFVWNEGAGTISVINTVTNSVSSTFLAGAQGQSYGGGVAVSPDGKKLFVAAFESASSNWLKVFDVEPLKSGFFSMF
jgi:YVTN family beta-propeller protein